MSTVKTYKCPSCEAGLKFSIDYQLWACEFCDSKYTLEQLEAEHAESLLEESHEDGQNYVQTGEEFSENETAAFNCPSCGGQIITDKNTSATFCPFCHNPAIIASRLDKQYRPARIIPFKYKKEDVTKLMHGFCKKRPLLPKSFKKFIDLGEISGMYVPYWLFSAELGGNLEGIGEHVRTWSDGNYRYTKTDTYRVQRSGYYDFENVPADGSVKMDDKLMEGLEPFDASALEEFSIAYLSGHFAESFDVDSKTAGARAFDRMKSAIKGSLRGQVFGYTHFRTLKSEAWVIESDSMYVLFPVWLLSVNYKNKTRLFAFNGQTGKINGMLPVSLGRLFAWLGSIFAAASIIAFAVLYFI